MNAMLNTTPAAWRYLVESSVVVFTFEPLMPAVRLCRRSTYGQIPDLLASPVELLFYHLVDLSFTAAFCWRWWPLAAIA